MKKYCVLKTQEIDFRLIFYVCASKIRRVSGKITSKPEQALTHRMSEEKMVSK
jgi:hypothetical protein